MKRAEEEVALETINLDDDDLGEDGQTLEDFLNEVSKIKNHFSHKFGKNRFLSTYFCFFSQLLFYVKSHKLQKLI